MISFDPLSSPEWRPWPGGDWFGPGCASHLFQLHPNARVDLVRKAEHAWYANRPDSGYQVLHDHPHGGPCGQGCVYLHNHPVDAPPPPEPTHDNRPDVRVKLHNGTAAMPTRAYPHDAGFDLTCNGLEDIVIEPGECQDVPCGVSIQWPDGVWGFLIGRSSTFRNRGIMVNPAIVDGGFRGELFAVCRNIGNRTVSVAPGERVAQIVPLPILADTFGDVVEVDELDPSDRGSNGFGSSGA